MIDRLMQFLVLEPEVHEVERAHLERINRIADGALALAVPTLTAIAWINDTGPALAFLTAASLSIGPWIARQALDERSRSHVIAFAGVCAAGLLVHFGQGPVQIEMHFAFFVLLGLLAVYGNPMVVGTAAATTAVHHLLVFAVAPASVFNYDASFGVVALHALFVVVQSPASMFIARSFHDNVIGLERTVAARTAEVEARRSELRLVLDAITEGLVVIDAEARMTGGRSKFADTLLGAPAPGSRFADALAHLSPEASTWFDLGWDAVQEAVLPLELAFAQLPRRMSARGHIYELHYRAVDLDGDVPVRTLVTLVDVTERVAREASELRQREMVAMVRQLAHDKRAFVEFVDEARDLVAAATSVPGASAAATFRQVHTLKGSAGQFGLLAFAQYCHELESAMVEDADAFGASERMELAARWQALEGDLAAMLGQRGEDVVEQPVAAVLDVAARIAAGAPPAAIAAELRTWTLDPAAARLARFGELAVSLGRRLNKAPIDVHVDDGGVYFDRRVWRRFWVGFTHAVRNAVDHGVEAVGERGPKAPTANLWISARRVGAHLEITLTDDGRGVAWEAVRVAAIARGVPCGSDAELHAALFADGVSTADRVSEISGRGVGMAALREATAALGGVIEVRSVAGEGATFTFRFPWDSAGVSLRSGPALAAA